MSQYFLDLIIIADCIALLALQELADRSAQNTTVGVDLPHRFPPHVEATAYFVVAEALTNAARHAAPATVTVRLAYGEEELTVEVDDDGREFPHHAASGTGSGIAGMRERAAALGGELEAGPRPGGGFRVRARLPLDGDR